MNRPDPLMPPGAYRTFRILSPQSTHWRPATCEEVGCGAFLRGWHTDVDEGTTLGQMQAHHIRKESGRSFTEENIGPGMVRFSFGPGQECFARGKHQVRLDRPEFYSVSSGDWRHITGTRQHASAADWVEDFGENQQKLADLAARG